MEKSIFISHVITESLGLATVCIGDADNCLILLFVLHLASTSVRIIRAVNDDPSTF